MRSRLRSTDQSLPLCMRATTNPGGVGHGWVKKMFIDPSPENKAFPATDIETGEILRYPKGHQKEGSTLFERRFIPARLKDNPYLQKDGQYEANLFHPYQRTREDNFWKVIGQLQMVPLFRSFDYPTMSANPLTYLKIGYVLGLVTLGIPL